MPITHVHVPLCKITCQSTLKWDSCTLKITTDEHKGNFRLDLVHFFLNLLTYIYANKNHINLCVTFTLVYGYKNPHKERLKRETSSLGQILIQFRVSQGDLRADILIQHETEHRKHGVNRRVAHHQESLIQRHRTQIEDTAENGLHGRYNETPMDNELGEGSRSFVRSATVHEQQSGEMGELRYAEIAGQTSLFALTAFDTDASIRLLDHAHVVAAVAHRRRPLAGVFLYQLHLPQNNSCIQNIHIHPHIPPFLLLTTCAFCVGEHLQQTTAGAAVANSMNSGW